MTQGSGLFIWMSVWSDAPLCISYDCRPCLWFYDPWDRECIWAVPSRIHFLFQGDKMKNQMAAMWWYPWVIISVLERMPFSWGTQATPTSISLFMSAFNLLNGYVLNHSRPLLLWNRKRYFLKVQLFQSIVLMTSWNLKSSNGSRQPQTFVLILGRNKPQIIITWNFLQYFQIKFLIWS